MGLVEVLEKFLLARQKPRAAQLENDLEKCGFSYGSDALAGMLDFEIEETVQVHDAYVRNILTRESINKFAEAILSNAEIRDKLTTFFNGKFHIDSITLNSP